MIYQIYRGAIALRRRLHADLPTIEPALVLADAPDSELHFRRGDNWRCVTTFGDQQVTLPAGSVVLSRVPLVGSWLTGDATGWVLTDG